MEDSFVEPQLGGGQRTMLYLFRSIGFVAMDGERMKLVGEAPAQNGVYAFFFEDQLMYVGVAKRANGCGLRDRIRGYLRNLSHIDGGTTSEIRVRIRNHVQQGGRVEIRVVTDCRVELFGKMSETDPHLFERAAIALLKPEWNRV